MVIYEPVKRTEPYVRNDKIIELYRKYKDELELIGASAEVPPKGLKSFVGYLHKVLRGVEYSK